MDNFVIDFSLYSKVTFRHTSTAGGGKWSGGDITAHIKGPFFTFSESSDQKHDNEKCIESKRRHLQHFICTISLTPPHPPLFMLLQHMSNFNLWATAVGLITAFRIKVDFPITLLQPANHNPG